MISDASKSFLSSQSHLKIFRVKVKIWSSQSRVTRTVDWLRVIRLQARANVESHGISRFFYDIFLLLNITQHAMKWHPIS